MLSTMLRCCVMLTLLFRGTMMLFNVSENCPYNTFCTSGPLKNMPANAKFRPCCEACLCSEDCSMFGKCCYDYDPRINAPVQKQIHFCQYQNELYNFPRNITTAINKKGFVFITNCVNDYIGNSSCLDMTDLNDYIPVSRKVDGRIFVNRKCALCNGVEDVVEWQLNLFGCNKLLVTTFSSIEDMRKAILESCIIYSTPPPVLYEDILQYECSGSTPTSSNCTNSEMSKVNNNQELCTNYSKFSYENANDIIYKTHNCLQCFENNTDYNVGSAHDDNDGICLDYSEEFKSGGTSFVFILSMTMEKQDARPCGVGEIYDPSQDVCTQLHCPTFYVPGFGVCEDFAKTAFYYAIRIELNFVTTSNISDSSTFGNRMFLFLKRHFNFYITNVDADHTCPFISLAIFRLDISSASVELDIFTSYGCTVYDILANTRTFVNNFKYKTISMGNEVTISNISLTNYLSNFRNDLKLFYILNTYVGRLRLFYVTEIHLNECPYVEIGIAGHPLEIRILEYARQHATIIVNNTLQVCVEYYFKLISKSCCLAMMNTLVFWCSVYAWLMQYICFG